MNTLIEVVNTLRPEIQEMYKDLRYLYRRIYRIDYHSLEPMKDLSHRDLARFKHYIDGKLDMMLDSLSLKKNGSYIDDSFGVKSNLVRVGRTMSFDEFVMDNLLQLYPFSLTLNEIFEDSGSLKENALKDRSLIKAIDRLAVDSKFAIDSFDRLEESLAEFNFEMHEEYTYNRDRWLVSDDSKYNDREESKIESIRRDTASLLCRAYLLTIKQYGIDYRILDSVENIDNLALKAFKADLEPELDALAIECGLRKGRTCIDDTFDLVSSNLSPEELSNLIDFMNSSGVLDTGLEKYMSDKDISIEIIRLNDFIQAAEDSIRRFRMFESELDQINKELIRRYKLYCEKYKSEISQMIEIGSNYFDQITDLELELDRSFKNLRWFSDAIFGPDYRKILRIEGLNMQDFENFRCDIETEIDQSLKKYKIAKHRIHRTGSFTLEPTNLNISKEMTILEFVESNMPDISRESKIINTIRSIDSEMLTGEIAYLLANEVINKKEFDDEIDKLRSFVQKVRDSVQEFFAFRSELQSINKHLPNEYKLTYHENQAY